MVGVAYRGNIPLEHIAIEFEVGASSGDRKLQNGVKKTITVTGPLTDEHLLRLKRASDFCPVGQHMTRRVTTIEDHVEFATGGTEAHPQDAPHPFTVGSLPERNSAELIFPAGKVDSRYLRETREWGEDAGKRVLAQEGEVNVYFACDGQKRGHRWAVLGGHTSESWGPRPVDFPNGALAASTVETLRRLVAPEALGYDDLAVFIESEGHGGPASTGRAGAQLAAMAGETRPRRVIRKVIAGGPLLEVPVDTIYVALKSDPMARFIQEGDILLGEKLVHGQSSL